MDFTTTEKQAAYAGMGLEQAREFISSADLNAVVERLIHVDGWSKKSANQAIIQYRNFLFLKKKYGHQHTLPPSYEIDEVWHAHVLHTKDYFNFCEAVFGEYLHHHPHSTQEASSIQELESLFKITQMLHQKEFGEPIYRIKRLPFKRRIAIMSERLSFKNKEKL